MNRYGGEAIEKRRRTMLMTEIRTVTMGDTPETKGAIASLAESAKSILGYDVLAKHVGTKTEVAEGSDLRLALSELEIDILNPADVLRYQKERLVEETTIKMQEWLKSISRQNRTSQFAGPGWGFQKISEYRQPVPEFVLAKAVQIKERVPDCEIYIESLSDHPDPFMFVGPKSQYPWCKPDELYYVEVWEEPKFEERLTNSGDIPF